MTDAPAPGQAEKKGKKIGEDLPEPPTLRQLKEAEMERDTAVASAERSAAKVEQLRAELKRAAEKARSEKIKLTGRLQTEVAEWREIAESAAADLSILQEQIRRDAPILATVRKHAGKDESTKGCSCPACQVHRAYSSLKGELATAKSKCREAKDALRSFQGPPSKKKGKKK